MDLWQFEEPCDVVERLGIMVYDGGVTEEEAWQYVLSRPDLYPIRQTPDTKKGPQG